MAYIVPSTTIQFMKNTGLSMSHENTLYFANEADKNSYWNTWFASNGQVGSVNNTYQRENRNYVRIGSTMSVMYNVDYMRFININFENKWFYAFVTGINYINNATVEVEYVLDPVMTWMGNFTFRQCWIERQHTTSDTIGGNIVGESVGINGYVEEETEYSNNWGTSACDIRIQYADPNEIQPNEWGGIYNPTVYADAGSASLAAVAIKNIVDANLINNIVNVYMIPTEFSNPGTLSASTLTIDKPYTDVDGYVPKNNKLFCFPYKYMLVDNSEGSQKEFYYEYFGGTPKIENSGTCEFNVVGTTVNNVEIDLIPSDYNGHGGIDYTDRMIMSHFPVCAWTYDTYAAYLAQKNAFLLHDTVTTGVNGFINGVVGQVGSSANYTTSTYTQPTTISAGTNLPQLPGPETHPTTTVTSFNPANMIANGLLGAGANVSKTIADNTIDNLIRPEAGSTICGSGNSDVAFQANEKRFTFHKMCITQQNAKMIDDYFTMFGYAIKNLGTPNMNARPHWTYIKTNGCNVEGSLPASDKLVIENLFDRGMRFWHSLEEMGDYSLDNSPA